MYVIRITSYNVCYTKLLRNEPHPTLKSIRNKLNPLQAVVYLGFKLVMAPMIILSGLLYLYYKILDANNIVIVSDIPLDVIAAIHTLGAYLIMAFAVVHVYMTTTGHSLTANIKAMLTGWEEVDDDHPDLYREDENSYNFV